MHIQIDQLRKKISDEQISDELSWKYLNGDLMVIEDRIDKLELQDLKLKTKIKELKQEKIPGLMDYLAQLKEDEE